MRTKILLATSSLFFASCVTTTFQDTLVRAELEGPLPRSPVHLMGADTNFRMQGSVAFTVSPTTKYSVTLKNPDQSDDNGNSGHGRIVNWNHEMVMGTGEISILSGNHFRAFAGIQGDLNKNASWLGGGFILGHKYPFEVDATVGTTSLDRQLEGYRTTILTENCNGEDISTCTPSSKQYAAADTTVWDHAGVGFTRIGLTWSRRIDGPYCEFAWTTFSSIAHTIEGEWNYNAMSTLAGAGWAFPTPMGTVVAGGRLESLGETMYPSLHVQWTGEFPLD